MPSLASAKELVKQELQTKRVSYLMSQLNVLGNIRSLVSRNMSTTSALQLAVETVLQTEDATAATSLQCEK